MSKLEQNKLGGITSVNSPSDVANLAYLQTVLNAAGSASAETVNSVLRTGEIFPVSLNYKLKANEMRGGPIQYYNSPELYESAITGVKISDTSSIISSAISDDSKTIIQSRANNIEILNKNIGDYQKTILNIGTFTSQAFKTVITPDSNTVAIGCPNTSPPTVFVLSKGANGYSLKQTMSMAPPPNTGNGFAITLDISYDGNTLLVGAPLASSGAGEVWYYSRPDSSSNFTVQGGVSIKPQVTTTIEGFGRNISISSDGNTAFIGSGLFAYIFVRSGTTFVQQARFSIVGTANGIISENGDECVVFGVTNPIRLTRNGTTWTSQPISIGNSSTDNVVANRDLSLLYVRTADGLLTYQKINNNYVLKNSLTKNKFINISPTSSSTFSNRIFANRDLTSFILELGDSNPTYLFKDTTSEYPVAPSNVGGVSDGSRSAQYLDYTNRYLHAYSQGRSSEGNIYLFKKQNDNTYLLESVFNRPENAALGSEFGYSFKALKDDSFLYIGAPNQDSNGSVYVATYQPSLTALNYGQEIKSPNPTSGARFGSAVASSVTGQRLFISETNAISGFTDKVHIFKLQNGQYSLETSISNPNADKGGFGAFLACSDNGNMFVTSSSVGANSNGAAYVYAFNGTIWSLYQTLTNGEPTRNSGFGLGVAMKGTGNTILVSEPSFGVHIFETTGGLFQRKQIIEATEANFGGGVNLSRKPIAISNSGAVIFIGARNQAGDKNIVNAYEYSQIEGKFVLVSRNEEAVANPAIVGFSVACSFGGQNYALGRTVSADNSLISFYTSIQGKLGTLNYPNLVGADLVTISYNAPLF